MERSSSSLHSSAARREPLPPRVAIEGVRPEVDGGRYPVKRVAGEAVLVEADVFADGHDVVFAELLFRFHGEKEWQAIPMEFMENDRWRASFRVEKLGRYEYTVRGWTDPLETWKRDLEKRKEAKQDISVDLMIGEELKKRPERNIRNYEKVLEVVVDPPKARFSSWYEMFPRSARGDGTHATFRDVAARLPYIAEMGFDVLYLPPIHPIGATARKGKNNDVAALPEDVGSPWAIGAKEGGHKAIHPQLGSFDDFAFLVSEAKRMGIEVALDIAFQCSPDHPYVKEHPEWFRWRPDGTVQYAENPPKKYQDIYPFEFETAAWPELFDELKEVFRFWISKGICIFRVDNPHTKPFAFWEWCIEELKREHPEAIFLAEAFTRPRIMHRLAKLGFTQTYTYFTWRNTKQELIEYFTELSSDPSREYFRPNVWPNTPDILHATLQHGGPPAFMSRAVLAATLSANYGLYGPAYELMEHQPREPGSEEYLYSEKYEIKRWDVDRSDSLRTLLAKLNQIRKANPALQSDWSLQFHDIDNDQLIAYSKKQGDNQILVIVNLDTRLVQSGWVDFGFGGEAFEVQDLLGGGRYYRWQGNRNYIELNPHALPAHIFLVHRRTHP
ncbi:MAG TPA: alpha-1,4-glucan--maltose-1-phosphate maltosyltransferase [Burkholderiales bacterium]